MEKQELEQLKELNIRLKNKMTIEIHKTFSREDLVNRNWYKVREGICSAEFMWTKNFPFGESGFVRVNTMDYQRVKRKAFIDCYKDNNILFSEDGEILIYPKIDGFIVCQDKIIKYPKNKPEGEVITTSEISPDKLYGSILEDIIKTREVKFVD